MSDTRKLVEAELCSIVEKGCQDDPKRTFESRSKFDRGMSSILSRFYKKLRLFDTESCVPYFVFDVDYINSKKIIVRYLGVRYETDGVSMKVSKRRFQDAQQPIQEEIDNLESILEQLEKTKKILSKKNRKRGGKYTKYINELSKKIRPVTVSLKKLQRRKDTVSQLYGVIGYDTEFEIKPMTVDQKETLQKINDGLLSIEAVEADTQRKLRAGKITKEEAKRPLIEIQTMLSHQFCFDIQGQRFGFVLSTEQRFTDDWFLNFLSALVEKLTGFDVKQYYIFAHFSLIEASWMDNSQASKVRKHKKTPHEIKEGKAAWKDERIIPRSRKKWMGKTCLSKEELMNKKGKPYKKAKFNNVWLNFCDTMDLYPASLDAAAEGCGFEKQELESGAIEDMAKYKQDHFEKFCRYGVRDAIVTAAIAVDIHSRFVVLQMPFKSRTSKYSEEYFKQFFVENYADYGNWRDILGQVYGFQEGAPHELWMPNKIQRDVLDNWYHGGRNEVKRVGCFGQAYYWDLKSAYPTSVVMMHRDFSFSRSSHYWEKDAYKQIEKLRKIGPFQPHGVSVFATFKKDAIPMFPSKVDGAITFPRIFHGWVTWCEFWTVLELDILDELTVIELTVFKALSERRLPDDMKRLLDMRRTDKLLYKNLLNYNYGKQIQGVSGNVPFSSITCPALGTYMTGFCRASIGELANLNKDYYAITTDGFISPQKKLNEGALNKLVSKELKTIHYDWIELDAVGTKSFFIKTRGYALWNGLKVPLKQKRMVDGKWEVYTADVSEKDYVKKAGMGMQVKDVGEFVSQINAGKGNKRSFPGFSQLDAGEISVQQNKEFTVNTTFDMKFVPISETIHKSTFELDDITLSLVSFETRPIEDIYEYRHLRELAKIKDSQKYEECKKRGLNEKEIRALLTTHAIRRPHTKNILWEFRKRLARHVPRVKTTWTAKEYKKLLSYSLSPIAESYGDLKTYTWIFKIEIRRIKDKSKRTTIRNEIVGQMEASRPKAITPPPSSQ